ncbi:alpha/beta fold hydrolase [Roseivivax sp. CAU 1761]
MAAKTRMRDRNAVSETGQPEGRPMVFVHGFGCDQTMWNQVAPHFEADYRVIAYDLTGMGRSDLGSYDPARYGDLVAHAADLQAICEELDLRDAIVVGHSVGASIAVMAAARVPGRIGRLVMVSPSPCFLNDAQSGYRGGFDRADLEALIALLDENHLGWSMQMAPTITGQPEEAPATQTLTQAFCRTEPAIAAHFGRVTFFADSRPAFEASGHPALILHCSDDALVPDSVAGWLRTRMPGASVTVLRTSGHCPHMTVPGPVCDAIRAGLPGA